MIPQTFFLAFITNRETDIIAAVYLDFTLQQPHPPFCWSQAFGLVTRILLRVAPDSRPKLDG